MNREKPFRMKDKSTNFMEKKWMSRVLSALLQKYYKEYPKKFLEKIRHHSDFTQSDFAKRELPKQLKVYSEE